MLAPATVAERPGGLSPPPVVLGLLLGLIGLGLNAVEIPVLGQAMPVLRLGAVAVFAAFARFGAAPGAVAALVAFSPWLGAGALGVVLAVNHSLESWLAARLGRRWGSLPLSVLLYWVCLGWPLDALALVWWLGVDPASAALLGAAQVLYGSLNALVAEALLAAVEARASGGQPPSRGLAAYGLRLAGWTVLAPTLLLALLASRVLAERGLDRAADERRQALRFLAVQLAAREDAGDGAALLASARRDDSQGWWLLDREGRVLAEAAPPDSGPPVLGAPPATRIHGRRLPWALRGLGWGRRLAVSEPAEAGRTLVLDAPLGPGSGALLPLGAVLSLYVLPGVLLGAAVWRLGGTLSRTFGRIGETVRGAEGGDSGEVARAHDIGRSPILEVQELAQHFATALESLAHKDSLTGLPNRKLLLDRLGLACAQALQRREGFALLFVDLDRFRALDRALGHALGNELLRRIARRLEDCVSPGDTVARVGGDEFALLIPGMGRLEEATETARRVMESIKRPLIVQEREAFATASVGISLYPRDGQDAETLLKNATAATYVAKERGQDTYRRYTARITAREAQRLTIESGLRRALETGGLLVHYQPIVGLQAGVIQGAEALVRWDRPDHGIVPATDFVPVAEASGLISSIDSWVLRQACAEAARWTAAGHPVRVAVNLSARHFHQGDLVDEVAHALRETGLPPRLLEVEITEGAAMQDVEGSIETLRALRLLGISVAVDDFGTGYSSLSYLKRLPVDRVKLDQSFVRDLTTSSDDAAIASAVIAMAHSLALGVVAEGVETEEQMAFLRRHECDALQGYLLSRPVPPDALRLLLEQGRLLPLAGRQP